MGLYVNIYRSDYDSDHNIFHGSDRVCVVNVEGPFEPVEQSYTNDIGYRVERTPAAMIVDSPLSGGRTQKVLVPAFQDAEGNWQPMGSNTEAYAGPMFGGTYAAHSDSRWGRAADTYAAIPIHDRVDDWDTYYKLTQ